MRFIILTESRYLMNIQPIPNYSNNINFSGAFDINKLKKVIPQVTVGKNFTYLDKVLFRSYVDSKPYIMGLSHNEISELNKFNGEDFVYRSYDLLTQKLGYGVNVRPQLFMNDVPGEAAAMYMNLLNVICVDPKKIQKLNKTEIFGFIRHEIQHYIQNTRIMRHEKIGPKAIDTAVSKYYDLERRSMIHICSNFSDQDIVKMGYSQQQISPQKFIATVMYAKRCLATNNMEEFDKICQKSTEDYRKQLNDLRNTIINEMGVIKNDSSLTSKIENDFKEFSEMGYYNPDGTINNKLYAQSKIENEAYSAQGASSFEFSQEPCFMRYVKKQMERDLNNEQTIKFLNDVCV